MSWKVVIALHSATAVRQLFYKSFAKWLAPLCNACLRYDTQVSGASQATISGHHR
ncbi:MAG: putative alpha/beta hydrolase [Paracoccaceae bacterium]|jgi:predicted alpha/beta hydrolase